MPPLRYLRLWRMQIAAGLLADGALPVGEVARRVGYDSEAAFSRSFKQLAGMPPEGWRRRDR
jgi:AraC-like DNA-binding protein